MARRTVPIRVNLEFAKLLRKVSREQSKKLQRPVTIPELTLAIYYFLMWEQGGHDRCFEEPNRQPEDWWSQQLIAGKREERLKETAGAS